MYNRSVDQTFKFDVILEEEDLCNREREKKRLIGVMRRQGRIVIYSLRRMGKTSLVHVCSQKIKQQNPRVFNLYVDLNEVVSLEEIAARFRSHHELALKENFPIRSAQSFLNTLLSRLNVNLPGDIELSLDHYAHGYPEKYLLLLFDELNKMSKKNAVVLILDEFQGIANQSAAQALLRREVKKLNRAAIVLMGSNQRLLYKMFNDKTKPFFGFGEDLELGPIPLVDYLPYMNERFGAKEIIITKETASYLIAKMNQIPNYINELCAWIVDTMENIQQLTKNLVDEALEACVASKRGRYESALYGYNHNQKIFLKTVARLGRVKAHTGMEMKGLTGLTATELTRVHAAMEDSPLISRDINAQLFILDPFLQKYLELIF